MDHITPGFRWSLAPITAEGQICDCKDRKQPGLPPFRHAADCDKEPTTDATALTELIKRVKEEMELM